MFSLLRMRCPLIQCSQLHRRNHLIAHLNSTSSPQLHLQLRNLVSQRLNLLALRLQKTPDLAQDLF